MDPRRLGIVTCARSDRGHTALLREATGARWVPYPALDMTDLDAVMIPTDRWEMGEAACRALGKGLPIVQLYAGESTPYCFDDDIRHFVSRVAALRFCCHEVHRQRLLSMGIPDETIHVCGAPGLDKFLVTPRLPRKVLARDLRLDADRRWAVVILHPTTRGSVDPTAEIAAAVMAVEGGQALWFTPGRDPGRDDYGGDLNISQVTQAQWVSLLYEAAVLIGNSSALVIEAPFVGLRTVEIGVRQKGRERVPYGDGKSVPQIAKILQEWTP